MTLTTLTLNRKQALAVAKLAYDNGRAIDVQQRFDGRQTHTYAVQHGTGRRFKVSQLGALKEIRAKE